MVELAYRDSIEQALDDQMSEHCREAVSDESLLGMDARVDRIRTQYDASDSPELFDPVAAASGVVERFIEALRFRPLYDAYLEFMGSDRYVADYREFCDRTDAGDSIRPVELFAHIQASGIEEGMTVVDSLGKEGEVVQITHQCLLWVKGIPSAVNPLDWRPKPE
jgi:hypothetical protein